jgi:REP element-mobilizing transposase RayT
VSHVQHHLYFHVVWATKLRAPAIIASVRPQVWAAIGGGVVAANGRVEAIGGVEDHVHLLLRLPPTVTLASVIKRAKGTSSHLIGQIHPELGFCLARGLCGLLSGTGGASDAGRVHSEPASAPCQWLKPTRMGDCRRQRYCWSQSAAGGLCCDSPGIHSWVVTIG